MSYNCRGLFNVKTASLHHFAPFFCDKALRHHYVRKTIWPSLKPMILAKFLTGGNNGEGYPSSSRYSSPNLRPHTYSFSKASSSICPHDAMRPRPVESPSWLIIHLRRNCPNTPFI